MDRRFQSTPPLAPPQSQSRQPSYQQRPPPSQSREPSYEQRPPQQQQQYYQQEQGRPVSQVSTNSYTPSHASGDTAQQEKAGKLKKKVRRSSLPASGTRGLTRLRFVQLFHGKLGF